MKKLGIVLLGLLIIASCRKPQDATTGNSLSDYIVGKWNVDELEVDITADILGNPVQIPAEAVNVNGYYNFKADKSYDFLIDTDMEVIIPGAGVDTIPYNDKGNGTYQVVSNEEVRLTQDGRTSVIEIKSSSPSSIVAEMVEQIDTMTMSLDLEIDMVLKK